MAPDSQQPDLAMCSCSDSRDNLSDFPDLKDILPLGYKYTVCNWKRTDPHHFESRFRVEIRTERQAELWLNTFSEDLNTKFERDISVSLPLFPSCEEANIKALRCVHTTEGPPRRYKDLDVLLCKNKLCPTRLVIILKLPQFKEKYECHDVHSADFPMTVIYHQQHNHAVEPVVKLRKDVYKFNMQKEDILNHLDEIEADLQRRHTASVEDSSICADWSFEDSSICAYWSFVDSSICGDWSLDYGNVTRKRNPPETPSYYETLAYIYLPKFDEERNQTEEDEFLLPPETEPFYYTPDSASLEEYLWLKDKKNNNCPDGDRPVVSNREIYFPILSHITYTDLGTEILPGIRIPKNLEEIDE